MMHSPSGGEVPNLPGQPMKGNQNQNQPPIHTAAGPHNARDYTSQFQQSLDADSNHLLRIGSNRYQSAYRQLPTTRSRFQRNDSIEDPHSLSVREVPLEGVKYGVGHEKYPSWPTSTSADEGSAATQHASHRSKSWTDRMCYSKDQAVYARPFMKRMAHPQPQQLKPVSEGPDKPGKHDNRGCSTDASRTDLDTKERTYSSFPPDSDREYAHYHRTFSQPNEQKKLTQAELEEYTRNYEETLTVQHQKQSSYAQSEGYHSYVSSTDSTSTPFLDRLRREADVTISRTNSTWESRDRDSVVTTSSETASTSETLKWHGSLSDLSVASSSFSSTSKQHQLIAHSSKVKTPQRHGSESVLYIDNGRVEEIEHRAPPSCQQHLKLFPISTYAVPETDNRNKPNNFAPLQMSVAERVSELERKNMKARQENNRQSCDLSLKAKQKKSVLSFYERQKKQEETKQAWRSEPHLISSQVQVTSPTKLQSSSRRASTASEYADWKENINESMNNGLNDVKNSNKTKTKHISTYIPDNSRLSPNSILDGPVIVGSAISVDDWVPERPPKNPQLLRNAFPDLYSQEDRLPSPELPLPSPPTVIEDVVFNDDEPFPPLPAEIVNEWKQDPVQDKDQIYDSKILYSSNLPTSEKMLKPTPVRKLSKHDAHLDKSNISMVVATNRDQSILKPSDVSLPNSNILPAGQSGYSRPICNFKNDKLFRNSFRVSQESSMHSSNIDVRASMRHYRNNPNIAEKLPLPQKQTVSAQKLLFRSPTVDVSSPKRVLNPFSRSTSVFSNTQETPVVHNLPAHQVLNDIKDFVINYKQPNSNRKQGLQVSQSKETNNGADSRNCECDKCIKLVSKPTQICSYTESRVDVKNNVASNNLNALNKNHGSQEMKHNINLKKQMPFIGPPPLYPKHQSLMKSHEVPAAPSLLNSNKRVQDTSSYTPSRAALPDSDVGSYKLIHKDGTYSARPVETIPDSPTDCKTTRFAPQTEKDNLPNSSTGDTKTQNYISTETIKKTQIESVNSDTENNESAVLKIDTITSNRTDETSIVTEKTENKQVPNVLTSVSVQEYEAGVSQETESQKNNLVDLWGEQEEACWAKLDLELEWQRIRKRLLIAMPSDHRLRKHLMSKDLMHPSDFIRDYFSCKNNNSSGLIANTGETEKSAESSGTGKVSQGGSGMEDAPSVGATATLIDLKRDAVYCCEKLVQAIKAEIESSVAAAAKNEAVGASIQARLNSKLATRFAVNNTEVHHISALMAGLSARLARTHDEIAAAASNLQTLQELNTKRTKLEEQMAEARGLKADIDKRSSDLDLALANALDNPDELHEARVFLVSKARLNIRSRHLSHRLDSARDTLRLLRNHLVSNEDLDR